MTIRAATLFLLTLAATPAAAQESPRFCPNRPDLGSGACTIEPGRVMAEVSGIDWQRSPEEGGRADSFLFGDLLLRTGLDDRTEVQLSWTPLAHYALRDGGAVTDRMTGVGDVRVGVRRNLKNPDGSGFSIAVEPFVTLPTGAREIGRGDWSAGVVVPVGMELGSDWSLAFTGEADAETDESGTGRHAAYAGTLGLGRSLGDKWDAVVELALRRDDDPEGHETEALAAASLAYKVGSRAQVDVLAVAGLNRTSPDVRLVLGGALLF